MRETVVTQSWLTAPGSMTVVEIPIGQLHPSSHRARQTCVESDLQDLANSLHQVGLLEPLCVRPLGEDQYEIIAGERRWRAAQLAALPTLSCRIFEVSDNQAFVLALIDNVQRSNLTPLEEAYAYQSMLDRGIVRNRADIARLLGVQRPRITQRMKLLELDPMTQRTLKEHPDLLTESHGRLLLAVTNVAARHQLAEEVIEFKWSRDRLRIEIEKRRQMWDIQCWQSDSREVPRSYVGNYTGFSFRVDLARANLRQAAEIMMSAGQRLLALAAQQQHGRTDTKATLR